MPVYIGKSGDLVRCYRCLTDRQTTEYRATQLVSSIKHKLSHATQRVSFPKGKLEPLERCDIFGKASWDPLGDKILYQTYQKSDKVQ